MSDITSPPKRTVLVTGANGTIGNGTARAFVRAGYTVYGLIRNPALISSLAAAEIIPLLGSPDNLDFLPELYNNNPSGRFDVIVSTTEQILNYIPHYTNILSLLHALSTKSNASGTRPLVLFTSGCKDYGTSPYHNDPNLLPHTEQTPLNPPEWALNRAIYSLKLLSDPTNQSLFDAIVLRPTTIYGYHSSFYGPYFDIAQQAKERGVLELPAGRRDVVLHGTHVDDCGEAYVALADRYLGSEEGKEVVRNKCYNISSHWYETLSEVGEALVREYEIPGGIKWISSPAECGNEEKGEGKGERGQSGVKLGKEFDVLDTLTGYSQWVGSEQLRRDTGWRDRRLLFSEGVGIYRMAYEEAVKRGNLGIGRIRTLMQG